MEILHNFIPTANGKIIAIIHWYDGYKYCFDKKFGNSEKQLQKFIDNKTRDIILIKIKEFVNHRQYALDHSHTPITQGKINAITKIKKGIDVYSQSHLLQVSAIIICLTTDLIELLPGVNSKYYNYYNQSINQLLTYCKNLNNGVEANESC